MACTACSGNCFQNHDERCSNLHDEFEKLSEKFRKLKEVEEWFQAQKTNLSVKKASLNCSSRATPNQGTPVLSHACGKIFEQLRILLAAIQLQELRILEVKEEIQQEKMRQEFKNLEYMFNADYKLSEPVNYGLNSWYSEMIGNCLLEHPGSGSLCKDELFYNVAYAENKLTFSTQRSGVLARITIEAQSSSTLKVWSSVAIDQLQEHAIEYLTCGRCAVDFVTEVVWKSIDLWEQQRKGEDEQSY